MSFTSRGPKGQPEKGSKPKVDTPKYNPEKGQKKLGDKPTTNPNTKPINKIEPHTIPPNYKPKNKIEQHTLPPNYKPKNKIERHTLPPNYKPKNKIERHTLPPNYKPKNKIERPILPPNYTPKNKIKSPTLPPDYTPRNKIPGPGGSELQPQLKPYNISKNPKSESNHKPSNSPEAEIRKNITQSKWAFINYDKNGNKISREQKLQTAVDYFNKNILPELNDKFRVLNYDINGKLISYDQKLENAKQFYTNEIIPNLVDKKIIRPGETPGLREIVKGGYSGFFPSLAFRGQKIDYNDLVTAVGLKPNITQGRWDFIKYDQDGNILFKEEKLGNAVDYFSKNVYPDLVQKGIIKEGEPPTSLDLMDNHQDFLDALRAKEPKVSFNHFIEYAGFEPKSYQTLSAIGQNFHWNAEKIFMEHTRYHNCKSFYEVNENGDNTIFIDDNFKKLSYNADFFANIRPDIKIINVDYYLGASKEHARDHSLRGYQDEGKALFLTSVKANEPQPIKYQAPHDNNIFILDTNNFAQFMGYQGDTYHEFMETVDLAKKAIYDEDAREILKEKAVESIEVIKNNQNDLNYSTKEFKEFL